MGGDKQFEIETPVYDGLGSFILMLTTFSGIILARICTHHLCAQKKPTVCYMVEFPLIVLPCVLSVMAPSNYSALFVSLMILLSIWFVRKTRSLSRAKERSKFYIGSRPIVFTILRSLIHLITSVCILAVDFASFYRPYRKSEFFGSQLMDTGIGLFVFSMGIVSKRPHNGAQLQRSVFGSAVPIILLGVVRTMLVVLLKYHLAEHEYGRHLNAFFILGLAKLFGSLVGYLLSSDDKLLPMGVGIVLFHQDFLTRGLSDYVQTNKAEPQSLLEANRQGLASVPGFVGMYLLAIHYSNWLRAKPVLDYKEMVQKLRELGLLSLICWCLTALCTYTSGICRVTSNVGYVSWMCSLFTTMTFLVMFVFEFNINSVLPVEVTLTCPSEPFGVVRDPPSEAKDTSIDYKETCADRKETLCDIKSTSVTYVICESVNANGLTYFLVANAFTGLVNMYLAPDTRSTPVSIAILVLYMFLNSIIVYRMFRKQTQNADKSKIGK